MWAACCEWDLDQSDTWLSPRGDWDDFNRLGWIFCYIGNGFRFIPLDLEPF